MPKSKAVDDSVHSHRPALSSDLAGLTTSTTARRANRPVPSPLQASTTVRSVTSESGSPCSPRTSSLPSRASKTQHTVPTLSSLPVDRVRAPNPAKRAANTPELEAIRDAATRDALKEEAQQTAASGSSRNVSAPVLAGAQQFSSPPSSPTMSSSSSRPAHREALRTVDGKPTMPRNVSIDSTVSSVSSGTAASQRANGTSANRVPQENASSQDAAALIVSAGSAEAAVMKLLNEKNQAASHNAQLWRLVEKQRSMIMGLNKDLEKSLKEKERYRKKLKDQLVQSQSAPLLSPRGTAEDTEDMETRESPVLIERSREAGAVVPAIQEQMKGLALESRKVSDASDVDSMALDRSDSPQNAAHAPMSGIPATPQTGSSTSTAAQDRDATGFAAGAHPGSKHAISATRPYLNTATPPISPKSHELPPGPHSPSNISSSLDGKANLGAPNQNLSSPKSAIRKAPPAPLQLSPRAAAPVTNNLVEESESEYEEEPESARAEQVMRGRRKTREDDDREREEIAVRELEARSRSKKEKKSKSRPAEQAEMPSDIPSEAALQPDAVQPHSDNRATILAYQDMADPAAMIRQRAYSDAAGLQKSNTAPSLMSPGLPMSPRPIDKPLNSPMPRAPKNAIPMSPRAGLNGGLPLSPRAPRQPIPLPPQTPLALASPHLARAETYHHQGQSSEGSISDRLKPSPDPSPELERPSMSSDPNPKSPGEVYRGLVVEQYPDLLLPPNALPSIYVKTSSSRMKPSRQSYVAPKYSDESPVLTLAVHERSDNKQLWRIEKTLAALASLDSQIKTVCGFRDRLPDKTLFAGHAPAKMDARRAAIDAYFDRMLESVQDERAAKVVCKFLSSDAMGAESGEYFPSMGDGRPDTPVAKLRTQRAGYLTKRGKNFGGWKARFFVLDGPNLKYFEAPGGAHLGLIKLQNAQIGKQSSNAAQNTQDDEDNQFRHAFLILEPKKKDSTSLVRHVLCAESDEERDAWVEALLQYVDYRSDEEDTTSTKGQQFVRAAPEAGDNRVPRAQKSTSELTSSTGVGADQAAVDGLRTMSYNDTVAGQAPVIGPAAAQKTGSPSPPYDGSFTPSTASTASSHPTISGPTNVHVISNAGDWGMKAPPTPHAKDHSKDKKRSMFAAFRGRSSSDLASSMMSPGPTPTDPKRPSGIRAVFGVPLAEAVEYAHPADATTELPAVVYRCIEYLTIKNAIAEEGIFRLSGSNAVIKGLKDRFNTEGDVNLVVDDRNYDIHAVASLMKLYLRELPASILTRELHLDFIQCQELPRQGKLNALNVLVNKLPKPNRALLQALSAFLGTIVDNAEVNKMNVRNVGIVFAPTLNVPAPLITSFVEDQGFIFGAPVDEAESPISASEMTAPALPADPIRSPRKQMFSDLPTPGYHQTSFQSYGGMTPMQPSYAQYQMAPQGEGGYGSLNDALRSPGLPKSPAPAPSPPQQQQQHQSTPWSKRRESGMGLLSATGFGGPHRKSSSSKLREEQGTSF
ncbi:RhoGAP-domain-containing protein [Hortaea werneckii]|nr:RhoGAP-domain-containing protein [Hortaea werneckii]KAI6883543.1 RhoGAP-domain-containing protein [Hortaea werneckii]KAI6992475.1 RhoGAP-domain-containing protein [Hortaea werneckii]KAI7144972.1 RhoGAP-domain-containing protein [Hortaea werneckii]KAI7173386.1 RhoGAP-domain-containing protein [Hortaea werneckii]